MNLQRKNLQETLRQIQETDLLTGFYTRAKYLQRFQLLEENMPSPLGVLFIHINDLKKINMDEGFMKGDRRIKHVSDVLESYFDLDFYRVSGNKIVAFYPFVDKRSFENEMREFQNYLLEKEEITFTVGHAWVEKNYKLLDVIHHAERLMYMNKQKYYKDNVSNVKDSSIALKELLTHIDNQDFEVYLQPQVYLKDNSLHGAESLIRLYDKEKGRMIPPDQFISRYEKNLIIRHIDIYVIEQVCQILACWIRDGKEIPISVNISRITLLEHGIIDQIVNICEKYNIPHHLLGIETQEQADMLLANHCLLGQGYLYSRPISVREFQEIYIA